MKNLLFVLLLGLGLAAPGYCTIPVSMPEPGMVGELAAAAVGFAGLVFVFRKKKR
jgi:hypothetical protein